MSTKANSTTARFVAIALRQAAEQGRISVSDLQAMHEVILEASMSYGIEAQGQDDVRLQRRSEALSEFADELEG